MKSIRTFLLNLAMASGIFFAADARAAANTRWYVNSANSGKEGDGLSWQTAFASLQSALASSQAGDEIWVMQGIYYPDANDRNRSFELKTDVSLYGGFTGKEMMQSERDWLKNETILSGNIGNGDKTKNTVTIVKGADRAVLDGFIIRDAYSTDQARLHLVPADITKNDMAAGGGMRNFKTGPVVRNCIFKNNFSPKGGAVYNVQDAKGVQAQFTNVSFCDNSAQMRGGGMSNDLGAMPTLINCQFLRNVCDDKGGGIYNDFAASPILLNCLLEGNRAVSAGGMGNDGGSSPLLVNVTIRNNTVTSGLGAGLYQGTGANNNPVVINSIVDNIYNWHEDIVAAVNSQVPAPHAMALKEFINVSSLKGKINHALLNSLPNTPLGYQSALDGNTLTQNQLVAKLLEIYRQSGGAIKYANEYTPPAVTPASNVPARIYVASVSKSANPDGSSWDKALTDVQQAINLASQNGGEIWIQSGSYRPDKINAQIAAFILYDKVKLYGGFTGTEQALTDRKVGAAPTVLSGKTADGNQFKHVLYGANDVVLDNLTIRDGKADGSTFDGKGGGLLAYHAGKTYAPLGNYASTGFTITVNNCRFADNQAIEGGAIYAFSKAKLTVSDTVFDNNRAIYGGAVLSREGNTFNYTNCVFNRNQAVDGGAVYEDYGAHGNYLKCQFTGNIAQAHGGAMYLINRASQLESTVILLAQCSFNNNRAPEGESVFNLDGCQLTNQDSNLDLGSQSADFKTVANGVKYKLIGQFDIERLKKILSTELAEFSSFSAQYPAPANAVDLYQVVYPSVVPEWGNRQIQLSGLVAVPHGINGNLPLLSYQHGTVFSRDEVPSVIEKSMETRMAVATFAANGYVVIAADYVGKGVSNEPDGWLVKDVSAQACMDMLAAGRAVMGDLKITPGKLFLSGWSQGSFTSAAFMEKLEQNNIPVAAAAMASAPNDIDLAINRWIFVPSKLDVDWLTGAAALMLNSYQNYYRLPGLTTQAIKPEYQQVAEGLYQSRISWEEADKTLPDAVRDLYNEEFLTPNAPAAVRLLEQLRQNDSYRRRFATPTFYYYGDLDEVVTPYMAQLPVEYQKSVGGAPSQAVFAGKTANHRGTYVFALPDQKAKFDQLLK